MKIYTTYFSNLKNLPSSIIPISICGKAPADYTGLQYKVLAPKYWFFKKYKEDHDAAYYTEAYNREVLAPLKREDVLSDLETLSGGKDIALVCYERRGAFCHRYIAAQWLGVGAIELSI